MPNDFFPPRPPATPTIYAYEDDQYPGQLKVGYTTHDAQTRVAQQYPTKRPGPPPYRIVLVTNLTIAGVTPPVGQMMFISSQVMRVPMDDYTVEVLPFLGAMLLVLLALSLFPQLTVFLPNLAFGK